MTDIIDIFPTRIYRAQLAHGGARALDADIAAAALSFARDDAAGRKWCRDNAYPGYTSYGSLCDLPARVTCFAQLKKGLDAHARAFSEALSFDLGKARLKLDNLWVNVMDKGGVHSGHIHPHSVISGAYYAAAPLGSAPLKFEDPRLAMMMAAPPRRADAPDAMKAFVYLQPEAGTVLMWESWLRHEVTRHDGEGVRISVSFNYRWT